MKMSIDWEAWVYGPGLAPVQMSFTTPKLVEAQQMAASYIAGAG